MNNISSSITQDVSTLLKNLSTNSEEEWQKRGDKQALNLFKKMSERVPAYKDFLKKNSISSSNVKTIKDFKKVPPVDKDNYLRKYSLPDLCWDGELSEKQLTISSTSGSTGEPFYFPRTKNQDLQYALLAEVYLKVNYQADEKSTLYIVGFPMGQWIGGVFTYEAIRIVAERTGWPLSVITPGVSSQEIVKAVKNLGPHFDQVIIGSYGPFLKDTLDEAESKGLDWKKYNVGFIFAAEVFSESFRDYVAKKTGVDNLFKQTLNQYGTVDLGTMAYETPLSILIRRESNKKEKLFNELFNHIHRVPTLTQFLPELFYFEDVNNNLYCSAFSGLPLVRYDLKDKGGVVSMKKMRKLLDKHQVNLSEIIQQADIGNSAWELPFVYVYERSDFSVSYYAFQIYPETIRRGLLIEKIQEHVTGKFTMMVNYDSAQNQKLTIHVELKAGTASSSILKKKVQKQVTQQLIAENSEFAKTRNEKGTRIDPIIIFWPHRHPTYFNPKIKQKWVKK